VATINLTGEKFQETITNNDIVIVDFWATWCGPCQSFAPIYETVSDMPENSDIVFAKINTEEEQDLSAHFQIRSIPTLMIFREQVVLFAQPGMLNQTQLKEVIGKVREVDMVQVHKEIAEQQEKAQNA